MADDKRSKFYPKMFLNSERKKYIALRKRFIEYTSDSLYKHSFSSVDNNVTFAEIFQEILAVPQSIDTLTEGTGMDVEPDVYHPNIQRKRITGEIFFEPVEVQCLQTMDSLRKICEDQGLRFNLSNDALNEVDMIYRHKVTNNEMWYFVKWKNYETQYNTWEPAGNLIGSRELVSYYNALEASKVKVNKNLLMFFVEDLITRKPYDILTMIKVSAFYLKRSEKYVRSLNLNVSQLKAQVKKMLNLSIGKLSNKIAQKTLFSLMKFRESRKRVLIELQEWEEEINSSMPDNSSYIQVENDVDLETAPQNFQFIHDYINTVYTPKLVEPVIFCSCKDCFKEKAYCCPNDSEAKFAYNKHKRLILEPGYPIFECNNKCHCSEDCNNRVVQNGSQIKIAIFRTSNGNGWGLKCLQTIEKGQFVLEYLGEVITSELAEARGDIYDYVRRSYLFDLDYGLDDSSCCFTVDARHLGNAAHFINHSCNPNLYVFAVWINDQDPSMPRLAFFAKRKISNGEELTFDYKMQRDRLSPNCSNDFERIPCNCNSFNCRKFLF